MDPFMRDSDAFSWYMEDDPVLRSTVVAVAFLDRTPDWDVFVARLERATRRIPMFRQRLVESPGRVATPRWTFDDQFDMTWHLRRVRAAEPSTARTVVDLARQDAMTAFDRARPLWKFTLVEHLAGGRAALVMKVHHALMDGLGGIEMGLLLFDTERDTSDPGPLPDAPPPESVDTGRLVGEGLAHDWGRAASVVGRAAVLVGPAVLRAARHPVGAAGDVVELTRSVARTVAPVTRTLSPVMTERGTVRHLDVVEVDQAALKSAAATAGGSLNDGFMAGVTGGLRLYHGRHGATVDGLRVNLPISIRRPGDPMGGNRITLMRFVVPVGEPDPAVRIARMHECCRSARRERSLPYTNGIAGALNLLPRAVVGAMFRRVDFLTSDVPGFGFPVYLAGSLVERYAAFGPTIGAAVNTTLLSYDGSCTVGINVDTAAVPDPAVLVECLAAGFEEVLALAGEHPPVRLPLKPRGARSGR